MRDEETGVELTAQLISERPVSFPDPADVSIDHEG